MTTDDDWDAAYRQLCIEAARADLDARIAQLEAGERKLMQALGEGRVELRRLRRRLRPLLAFRVDVAA